MTDSIQKAIDALRGYSEINNDDRDYIDLHNRGKAAIEALQALQTSRPDATDEQRRQAGIYLDGVESVIQPHMTDEDKKHFQTIRAALKSGDKGQHPDDIAIDKFAEAMKAKMAKKREGGRKGWHNASICPQELLAKMLRDHTDKGDPVDVGNIAMMLFNQGWSTALPAPPTSEGV